MNEATLKAYFSLFFLSPFLEEDIHVKCMSNTALVFLLKILFFTSINIKSTQMLK